MKTILFILIFCGFGLFAQSTLACNCIKVDLPEKDPAKMREARRRYYMEQFHGALFTGKVIQSDVMWDSREGTRIRKVVVDVERFWLGVENPTVIVYTWPGDGADCGINFEVGKEYFFNPQYIEGVLKIATCGYYSNGLDKDPEISAPKLEEILGKPKTFPKPKN